MSRPRVFDCFPFGGSPTELLLLECRLTELYGAVDGFVIVEADTDHQGHPKAYNFLENEARFAQWADKIAYVKATGLPTVEEDPGVWAREHAQREHIATGLRDFDALPDDVCLQSDADEIPRAVYARNVKPVGDNFVGFAMRGHFLAIDWEYPPGWNGTVACRVETALKTGFGAMRDKRNFAQKLPNAGWHFSWLGGKEAWDYKVNTFCHPEVRDRIVANGDRFWREGIHVDFIKMNPVDVDKTWPKWMLEPGNVPESWMRPR
jgi:hypothetical protein